MGDFFARIDWAAAWSLGWPVLVAIPGLIAFWWQWRDRRAAAKPTAPYVEIGSSAVFGLKPYEGWQPIQFLIRNDGTVPIRITKVEVLSPRGVQFAMTHKLSRTVVPALDAAGSKRNVQWRVEPTLHAGRGGTQWSAQTLGFFGSTERSISAAQVSVRLTFSEMDAKARQAKIVVTSVPMELPQITSKSA